MCALSALFSSDGLYIKPFLTCLPCSILHHSLRTQILKSDSYFGHVCSLRPLLQQQAVYKSRFDHSFFSVVVYIKSRTLKQKRNPIMCAFCLCSQNRVPIRYAFGSSSSSKKVTAIAIRRAYKLPSPHFSL
jgi:hypothetical protein